MPRIVIIAGEASGDLLGAGLIRAVNALRPDIEFEGIAGPLMREAGCKAWRDADELAVMGLFEVLRHLPRLRRIIKATKDRLSSDPPDLLIGIDAPDFNLRIERFARDRGIATMQYVCPSVWAWREGRVETLRAACDQILCLLPFEVDFLRRHDLKGHFVGHPLADEIVAPGDPLAARALLGIDAPRVVALLPGSRVSEVSRLAEPFARTASWLAARDPALRFVVPVASQKLGAQISAALESYGPPGRWQLIDGRARETMAAADVVLLASGTATLEAMLLNRPMVVAYRISPLTYFLLRALRLIRVQFASLPNLLAGRRLVPELLQADARPELLGPAVEGWLKNPAHCNDLKQEFVKLSALLKRNASAESARVVLQQIGIDR